MGFQIFHKKGISTYEVVNSIDISAETWVDHIQQQLNQFLSKKQEIKKISFARQETSIEVAPKLQIKKIKLDKKKIFMQITGIIGLLCILVILYISTNLLKHYGEQKLIPYGIMVSCIFIILSDWLQTTKKLEQFNYITKSLPSICTGILYILGIHSSDQIEFFNEPVLILYFLLVTFGTYILSLRLSDQFLSILATIIGLSIPFIIEEAYDTSLVVPYSTLVITAGLLIHLFKGWNALLFTVGIFCWICMYIHSNLVLSRRDLEVVRIYLFIQWFLFWVFPIIREYFLDHSIINSFALKKQTYRTLLLFNLLSVIAASYLIGGTYYNISYWAPWALYMGVFYSIGAIVFAYLESKATAKPIYRLSYPNYVASVVLLYVGNWILLVGDAKYFMLAVEGFAVILISYKTNDALGFIAGSVTWIITLFWAAYVLIVTVPEDTPIFNRDAMIQGGVLSMMAIQSYAIKEFRLKLMLEIPVHAFINMWLYREFAHSSNTLYYVTALYPACVQYYTFLNVEGEFVNRIRMLFGDTLWVWLFISQTLPRFFLLENPSFVSSLIDVLVVCTALITALIHNHRLNGMAIWIYIIFGNCVLVAICYRDAGSPPMTYLLIAIYSIVVLIIGYLCSSRYILIGYPLLMSVFLLDYFLFVFEDVMIKLILSIFWGLFLLFLSTFVTQKKKQTRPVAPCKSRNTLVRASSTPTFTIPE